MPRGANRRSPSHSLSLSNVDSCCPWDFFLSNVSNVNNVISEIYRFRLAGRTLSCTPSQRRKQIEMLGRKIYWSFYFLFLPSRPLGLTSNNSICYTPLPPRHPSAENVPVLVMRCWWVCVSSPKGPQPNNLTCRKWYTTPTNPKGVNVSGSILENDSSGRRPVWQRATETTGWRCSYPRDDDDDDNSKCQTMLN